MFGLSNRCWNTPPCLNRVDSGMLVLVGSGEKGGLMLEHKRGTGTDDSCIYVLGYQLWCGP